MTNLTQLNLAAVYFPFFSYLVSFQCLLPLLIGIRNSSLVLKFQTLRIVNLKY
jgi:hypothetical protein